MSLENVFGDLATERTVSHRFGGGASSYAQVLTASDSIVPAEGKAIQVLWVSFIPNPDNEGANLVTVGFAGGETLYVGYAMAHWELFEGEADQDLNIILASSAPVAVTIHYKEVTP